MSPSSSFYTWGRPPLRKAPLTMRTILARGCGPVERLAATDCPHRDAGAGRGSPRRETTEGTTISTWEAKIGPGWSLFRRSHLRGASVIARSRTRARNRIRTTRISAHRPSLSGHRADQLRKTKVPAPDNLSGTIPGWNGPSSRRQASPPRPPQTRGGRSTSGLSPGPASSPYLPIAKAPSHCRIDHRRLTRAGCGGDLQFPGRLARLVATGPVLESRGPHCPGSDAPIVCRAGWWRRGGQR